MQAPVVVGIGSALSGRVVDWAAVHARRHSFSLKLVHASRLLVRDGSFTAEGYARLDAERTQLLADARERALRRAPELNVTTRLTADEPGNALVGEGGRASLIVVGARGTGGFDGLIIGSVGLHVAAHAQCPVLLVPESAGDPDQVPDKIVVGIDQEHPADHVIGWAYAEADLRGARLTALCAVGGGYGAPGQEIGEQMRLSEALAGWTAKYPDLPVTRAIPEMKAAPALVSASERAGLIVVGARHRRGRLGMALGRVNHAVLHHSRCPVVVVPEP